MLNQCIFIGRLIDVKRNEDESISIKIKIDSVNSKQRETIVTLHKNSLLDEPIDYLKLGSLVAAKARLINISDSEQIFIVDRLTCIGGPKNESEV